jgi:hypothetical protein
MSVVENKGVVLGGVEVKLQVPTDYALCAEIVEAGAMNARRAFAAALAACWRGAGRPTTRYDAHGYSPLKFGGAVMNELIRDRGLTDQEVMEAGATAWGMINRSIASERDVKAAEGFSEQGGPANSP